MAGPGNASERYVTKVWRDAGEGGYEIGSGTTLREQPWGYLGGRVSRPLRQCGCGFCRNGQTAKGVVIVAGVGSVM